MGFWVTSWLYVSCVRFWHSLIHVVFGLKSITFWLNRFLRTGDQTRRGYIINICLRYRRLILVLVFFEFGILSLIGLLSLPSRALSSFLNPTSSVLILLALTWLTFFLSIRTLILFVFLLLMLIFSNNDDGGGGTLCIFVNVVKIQRCLR